LHRLSTSLTERRFYTLGSVAKALNQSLVRRALAAAPATRYTSGVSALGRRVAATIALLLVPSCGRKAAAPGHQLPPEAPNQLRAAGDFASIQDPSERSQAVFLEASRVLLNPRCVDCHPSGDSPLQGDDERLHEPPVVRGDDDRGVVGMYCASCHQDHNLSLARVPGAPDWHLAKRSMGWQHMSPREVCEELKDPKRNGGRTLARVVEHSSFDSLVAWGWKPGSTRTPVPGTQAEFGALMQAWVDTGAVCPPEGAKPWPSRSP
jgi:hypothetical protein